MSPPENDKPETQEQPPPRDGDGAPPAGAEGASSPPAAPKVSEPPPLSAEEKLAAAQADTAKVRDQLLRTAADFDNFRKRSRREIEDAQKRGKETTVKELLPVFDNLERAAAHVENAPDVKSVAEGLRIVLKQFESTLDKMGVKRIPTVGQPFDPSVHEAIQHLPSAEHPAGVVLAEVQPGYALGDRLVRAAMVVVSKGPPEGDPTSS